jgi:hypothetical protein
MTEDVAICIDLNSAERVHLYPTRDGTRQWSANRVHPTVRTLGSYDPILHPAFKGIHFAKGIAPELLNAPVRPHGRRTKRRWSHSHLFPTDTFYPIGRYGSALTELNMALTPLSARWCVRKVLWSGWPTWFQTEASSCPPSVSKTPTPMLQKPYNRDTVRSTTLSPIPDQLFRAHPAQKYPKRLLLPALPHARQEPLFPSQHMHRKAQHIYTLICIHSSSRAIKDNVNKEGSARFIIMHLK